MAVWIGTKEKGGRIFTKEVEGLPHDSGRGELAGPVLAMRALLWIQEEEGTVYDIEMKVDNEEAIGICGRGRLGRLPSKVCARNAEIEEAEREL